MIEVLEWTTPIGLGIFFVGLGVFLWGAQSGQRGAKNKRKED